MWPMFGSLAATNEDRLDQPSSGLLVGLLDGVRVGAAAVRPFQANRPLQVTGRASSQSIERSSIRRSDQPCLRPRHLWQAIALAGAWPAAHRLGVGHCLAAWRVVEEGARRSCRSTLIAPKRRRRRALPPWMYRAKCSLHLIAIERSMLGIWIPAFAGMTDFSSCPDVPLSRAACDPADCAA